MASNKRFLQTEAMTSFLVLIMLYTLLVNGLQDEISLNGNNWLLSDGDKINNIPATVPGIVHLDLLNHKVIDDPYFGYNDVKYQWIAYSSWTYKTSFELTTEQLADYEKQLFIKCNGLDTIATVSVNGYQVGIAYNYFRRWMFNMTNVVKVGSNTLQVLFEPAANYSMKMKEVYPYDIYVGGDYIPNAQRNFIRKTQSDFGWDWGPAFVPTGIWQNISYVTASDVYVIDVVPKVHCNDSHYYIEVMVCYMQLISGNEYSMNLNMQVDGTPFNKEYKETYDFSSPDNVKICHKFKSYTVPSTDLDSFLWKPHSSNNPRPLLYQVSIKVSIMQNGKTLFDVTKNRKIGFRNIKIIQDEKPPNNEKGLLFYFQQSDSKNSYPIYIKGSNFIPMDAFVTRGTPQVVKRLLTSAIEGNQNMIRVWGGGLYQPDWFYDMCDELGLLVWQEFMFAVSLYPTDKGFLDNVKEEVIDNVQRLGYHPSIVLWSGNNENQAYAINNASLFLDYSTLYDTTIRHTLWNEDMTRSFWPSSPSNGANIDDPVLGLYVQRWGDSQDTTIGDIHRYDYFSTCNNVSTFPRPRFASEFGFQSYPSFYSLSQISNKSDWSNDSPFFTSHRQHHPDGNKQMTNMMKKFFHLPNNTDTVQQFKDVIYLTQVVQVICIGSEAEHYHRLLSEAGAYTSGTLYWQLNDIWQAQTWSSIEYGGRWKLLHYAMKKIYQEISVSAYLEDNDTVVVYVTVDDPMSTVHYSLSIDVISWEGKTINNKILSNLQSDGYTGKRVVDYSISSLMSSVNDGYLHISINNKSSTVLSSIDWFPGNFTQITLPKATISVSNVTGITNNQLSFDIVSDNVAVYVYLDSGSIEGYFSDNGFTVRPNIVYNMYFTGWTDITVKDFTDNINTRSLVDTY